MTQATIAIRAVVILGERVLPTETGCAPTGRWAVAFSAVLAAKVVGPPMTVATDVLQTFEVRPVVAIKALCLSVLAHQIDRVDSPLHRLPAIE